MSLDNNPPHPEPVEERGGGAKPALRKQLSERRARLHAERGWWAGEVAMARHPLILSGSVVAGYWPIRSEIDPRPLMRRYARAGLRIALPVAPARGVEEPLSFRLWEPGEPLATHPFGMQEPPSTAASIQPRVLIVPMLGFDGRGHRLGYGAGHYDRTLAALREAGPVFALGLAFAGQRMDQLPTHAGDQPLDAVLTEDGLESFARTA